MSDITFFCTARYKGHIPEPVPAYKAIPSWWKETSSVQKSKCPVKALTDNIYSVVAKTNIKTCPAVADSMSMGYVIPAWTNFLMREINGVPVFNWNHPDSARYGAHYSDQFDGMKEGQLPEYGLYNKFDSPWFIKTSPGVSCLITHPFWHREKRFTSVTGVMHTDVVPSPLKWFFELNERLPQGVYPEDLDKDLHFITKGQPLMLVIPFKRKNFASDVQYVNDEALDTLIYQSESSTHDWFGKSAYNAFRQGLGKMFR